MSGQLLFARYYFASTLVWKDGVDNGQLWVWVVVVVVVVVSD